MKHKGQFALLIVATLVTGCATSVNSVSTTTAIPSRTQEPAQEPTITPTAILTPTPTATTPPTEVVPVTEPPAEEAAYVPEGQSVWQLDSDPHTVTHAEACPEPYNFNFYGLVAVTPTETGIMWRRQDSEATLERTELNNFSGSLPGFLPEYDLRINVTFVSAEELQVNHTLVSQSNSDCTHRFDYGAVRSW